MCEGMDLVQKVQQLIDSLPDEARVTVIKKYSDAGEQKEEKIPSRVEKMAKAFSMLPPEEQGLFLKSIRSNG